MEQRSRPAPNPSSLKVKVVAFYLCRPARARSLLTVALAGCGVGACGTINEKLAGGMSDAIPAAIGGLPADAPPRPGTAKYDEYMRERERKRLLPASERGEDTKSAPASQPTR